MNALLDNSLVALLLVASVLYAFAKLGPKKAWRRTLAGLLARAPAALHLRSAAQRLAGAAAETTQGACGGCDNCASESRAAAPAGSLDAGHTDGGRTEIRVPIANIARARRSQQG
jgi:hypothetical protein